MLGLLVEIGRHGELVWILVVRNLKIRYKGSVLGFFWSLLSPLLMILIYGVFAGILKFNVGRPHYIQFLVIGIVMWQFLGMCLNDSLNAIVGNSNLVKKTSFPRIILLLSMVCANLLNFLLTWIVLLLYLWFSHMPMQALYLLPVVLAVQVALCLGTGLILSATNVFFRDTEHILGVGTLAWFFLSPIFYPVSLQLQLLPDKLHWMAFLNPMTGILWSYRKILMGAAVPDAAVVGPAYPWVSVAVAVVVLVLGLVVFQGCEKKFGDEL